MIVLIVLFNKPFGVLSQFTGPPGTPTLKDYLPLPGVYPAGRLDADSEGLLVLTDDGILQHRLTDPRRKQPKRYWVQVEGQVSETALQALQNGIDIRGYRTAPARAWTLGEPAGLWPRDPPIRFRQHIPTEWLAIELHEGRNRQVRRMTAAVGLPTLRLIRVQVGGWEVFGLEPGAWHIAEEPAAVPQRARKAVARR